MEEHLSHAFAANQRKLIGFGKEAPKRTMTFGKCRLALFDPNKTLWLTAPAHRVGDAGHPTVDPRFVGRESAVVAREEILRATAKRLRFLDFDEASCIEEHLNRACILLSLSHAGRPPSDNLSLLPASFAVISRFATDLTAHQSLPA